MSRAAGVVEEAAEHARELGLRYVSDGGPGWTRRRNGAGFVYLDADGRRITEERSLARIAGLVIPPAWERVWISPDPRGHVQATGRDAQGRKVYRYHDRFRSFRDRTKYDRLAEFAHALPAIRERVDRDMRLPCLSRERVLGIVVHLLDVTHMRVGNAQYARDHGHFGLTTLRRDHVEVNGSAVTFEFIGKSGQERRVALHDARVARAIRRCDELSGRELFKYVGDGDERRRIESDDVNAYIREVSGGDFTAKDFRTWGGTVIAAVVLREIGPFLDEKEHKANVVAAVKTTAAELGNRPATCRKYYIHPLVFEAYADGSLVPAMREAVERLSAQADRHRMSGEEAAVLALLDGAREAA